MHKIARKQISELCLRTSVLNFTKAQYISEQNGIDLSSSLEQWTHQFIAMAVQAATILGLQTKITLGKIMWQNFHST